MTSFGDVETPRVVDFSSIVDDLMDAGDVPAAETDDAALLGDVAVASDDIVVVTDLLLVVTEDGIVLIETKGLLEVVGIT